jgi:phosphate-induced protein 1
MKISRSCLAVVAAAVAVCVGTALAQQPVETGPPQIIIHKTNPHEAGSVPAGSTGVITPNITYHGGPVIGTPAVYLIWYGNWNRSNGTDTSAGQQIIRDYIYGANASPYFQINTSYSASTTVTGSVNFTTATNETSPGYTYGTNLSDRKVASIVSNAITTGALPKDANGVYFVLTSSDVNETSGFCTRYCGWHTYGTLNGTPIKYSFVGNAARCLNACAIQTTSPNGNAGVDGMASVVAHELEEATTDPQLNAWYDANGAENADKCAWTFGQNLTLLPSGAYYNMTLPSQLGGSRNFMIQRNLSAYDSKCYLSYPTIQ